MSGIARAGGTPAGQACQLRRIGLIGGIGWPSTRDYYEQLNREVAMRAGGLTGADLVLRSLDFAMVLTAAQTTGAVERMLERAAQDLMAAGAEVLGVCSGTGHLFCAGLRRLASVEFVGLDDSVGQALRKASIDEVFLLGTKRTMDHPLFFDTLKAYDVRARLPSADVALLLDQAIFGELEHGNVGPLTSAALDAVEADLRARGAIDVVLACTELPLALAQRPLPFRIWDSLRMHAGALADAAFTPKDPLDERPVEAS